MPNYVEIVKEIIDMLKKDKEVKWSLESMESFSRIKRSFVNAPVLPSPDYQRPFLIFSFGSPNTMINFLMQKNDEEKEQPIVFFSQVLRDAELKYNVLQK